MAGEGERCKFKIAGAGAAGEALESSATTVRFASWQVETRGEEDVRRQRKMKNIRMIRLSPF